MSDLIRREDAIDIIQKKILGKEKRADKHAELGDEYEAAICLEEVDALNLAIEELLALPSMSKWTSVKDRLPEENGHYLVTLHSYCKAFYDDGEDYDETRVRVMRFHNEWILPHRIPITESKAKEIGDEVLAWMPLPEAYKDAVDANGSHEA